MEQKKIDEERVRQLYNQMSDIWPADDKWYTYTHQRIIEYINRFAKKNGISDSSKVINIGSAGNEYGLPGTHYHVDIAEERIKHCAHYVVCSAEHLPFPDNYFDAGLCVGAVINYCDPLPVIAEISRVLKPGAKLVLDYDQSRSYEFIGFCYNHNAHIIETFNSGETDSVWVFSERLISSYCQKHGLKISNKEYYHLLTPLIYKICKDEEKAATYVWTDKILRYFPFLNRISCNIILTLTKH